MKPVLLFSTIVLATATPLLAADKSYDFKEFSQVVVRGGLDVEIRAGEAYSVELRTSRESLQRKVKIRKSGGALLIERTGPPSLFLMGLADRYHVTVTLPEINAVTAVGRADVALGGAVSGALTARASSGAELEIAGLSAADVSLRASSGAEISAEGSCASLSARVSSGADIEAGDLICGTVALRASSGGDLEAHATERAQAKASSGADIRLQGRASFLDLDQSSGGAVEQTG